MNERIQELAVTSGIYDSLCDPYDALNTGDYYSSVKIDLEKFAKLIVIEVLMVQDNLIANGHNAWHLHHPTKKHFEVL